MFGAFNLAPSTDMAAFKQAFDAFCTHLRDEGYLHSWRLWQRTDHKGYNTGFPDVGVMLEMRFHNHQASLDCWAYVAGGSEPMNSLHVAMNRQVANAMFNLYEQVG